MGKIKINLPISIETNVKITDETNNKILVNKSNAIHSQNMARILARGLSNEPNGIISRLALGNGGTMVDASDNIIFKLPNDGTRGDGWESRLYHETYSEIVDEESSLFRQDIGSADVSNIRVGGGSSPNDDPSGGGVVSQEVGTKSKIVITMFLNENEPSGQLATNTVEPSSDDFVFDELGLFSPGLPAVSTAGYSSVDVDNKTSVSISNIQPNSVLTLNATVDGNAYSSEITVPASGTGLSGEITYGDICEGINTGDWITSGDTINDYVYIYITDDSGATYSTIVGAQSYGYLTFESKSVGATSTVDLSCNDAESDDFFNVLTNSVCGNVNFVQESGKESGIANNAGDPSQERERMLTHLIFDPIYKASNVAISIVYDITVSVASTQSSAVNITQPPS